MIINGLHLINVHIKPYLNMVNLAGHRKVLQSIIYLKLKTHPNISVSINFRYANKPEKTTWYTHQLLLKDTATLQKSILTTFYLSEFLQKTYPKTYQHGEVNRIIGQVAIESRQGRHATDDSIVVAMLQGAKWPLYI